MKSSIEKRRKIRALEAKRDKLLEQKTRVTQQLAVVRTELKQERRK